MIRMTCTNCGRKYEFGAALAGLTVVCKSCSSRLKLPSRAAFPIDPADQSSSASSRPGGVMATEQQSMVNAPGSAHPAALPVHHGQATEPATLPSLANPATAAAPLPQVSDPELPVWRRHLHWLLILALFPLALSLLQPRRANEDFWKRVMEMREEATPAERERIDHVIRDSKDGEQAFEALFDALPEQKLAGALLPRRTWIHWTFAAGAAVLFMAFLSLLATYRTAEPHHMLWVGLFTASAGILLLLVLQWVADWSQGVWVTGGGVVVVLFYIVKLIGFSYRAALDPENGFPLSFVGYTIGVGFCEEVVKALPLLWLYRRPCTQSWRGAFAWGLASGAGFGIAEGVIYSGNFYNGVSGPGIYVVRFISCVTLHAVWTGSVGITLNRKQELIQDSTAWYEFILLLLRIVAVPMVLHGLYDTLLKKEMNAWALGAAVLSFLFLAYQISRLRGEDAEVRVDTVSAGR